MSSWKCAFGIALLSASLLSAEQFSGILTDQQCATKDPASAVGEVHKRHVADGQALVFVNEADGKIYQVSNPEKVESMAGQKVTLMGSINGDKIEAESASPAS
jgi:hypothetical protein